MWGSKGFAILLLVALLGSVLVLFSPPAVEAAPADWTERVDLRTRTGKTFQDSADPTRFATDISIGAVHYDGPNWKEINNTILPSTANVPELGLADYEMAKDDYEWFALDTLNTVPLILYRNRSTPASYIAFNPQALQWTNDLDQISLVSMLDTSGISALVNNNTLTWPDAYGAGRDLSYALGPNRMAKQLTLPAYPGDPPQFIIDGGNPVLELRFIFDLPAGPNAPDIYVDGNLWDKKVRVTTGQVVEFRVGGQTVFWFASPSAFDSSIEGSEADVTFILEKQGPNLEVGVRVPFAWLQNAIYPVVIDPTVDVQVGAGADDGYSRGPGTFQPSLTFVVAGDWNYDYDIWARFTDVTIPQGATIDVAYITIIAKTTGGGTGTRVNIYAEDVDSAVAPTGYADHQGKVRTTAFSAWDDQSLVIDTEYDSPSIVDVIKEIVDRGGWASGNPLQVLVDNDASDQEILYDWYSYEGDTAKAVKLHIEYTAGGQFARPDSDVTDGGWEDTTGGDNDGANWDEIDEVIADDGTTFVRADDAATLMEVGLTDVTDPGVDTGHVIRFRAYAIGGGQGERLDFSLYESTTEIARLNNQIITRDSWNTYTLAITTAVISDYTDLRLRFNDLVIGSGETIDVTWAELEVPTAGVTCDAITVDHSDPSGILYFNETVEPDGLPWTTEENVSASYQLSARPAFNVTNDASIACDITIKLMTAAPSGATLKYSATSTPPNPGVNTVPTDPSSVTVCTDVAASGLCQIWLWTDYSNSGPMADISRTIRVESS